MQKGADYYSYIWSKAVKREKILGKTRNNVWGGGEGVKKVCLRITRYRESGKWRKGVGTWEADCLGESMAGNLKKRQANIAQNTERAFPVKFDDEEGKF